MNTTHALSALAERIVAQHTSPFHTPGLVVSWQRHDSPIETFACGADAHGHELTPDTPFVLASASKLALGLGVLRLIDNGSLSLDTPLRDIIPHATAASDERVSIRRLLSHTAGLPLEINTGHLIYGSCLERAQVMRECLQTRLTCEPGTTVQYSNVGYGLLSLVVEKVSGRPLDQVLRDVVCAALDEPFWIGAEAPDTVARAVGVDSPHAGSSLEPYSAFWRSLNLPWANIVTTSRGLLRLALAYNGPFLSPALRREALSVQSRSLAGGFGLPLPFLGFNPSRVITWAEATWGLGVEIRGAKKPHWTPATASPDSFGHIGSSGVLAWVDPPSGVAWSILRLPHNRHGMAGALRSRAR